MQFLNGLDPDLKDSLKSQLRDLWSHTSTAIEGNTLTLGETKFVIEEGLTISGKPLKDHNEVIGHAKAIDLIYDLVKAKQLTEGDLFNLHRAVINPSGYDFYKPVGAWKNDINGANFYDETGKMHYIEFPAPAQIPKLMKSWIALFNSKLSIKTTKAGIEAYCELHSSFVCIHPFYDGNGRIARLVSNIPLLKTGYPPIIIENTKREAYIHLLSRYMASSGPNFPRPEKLINPPALHLFERFCNNSLATSLEVIETIHAHQRDRDKKNGIPDLVKDIFDPDIREKLILLLREKFRLQTALSYSSNDPKRSEVERLQQKRAKADLEKKLASLNLKIKHQRKKFRSNIRS